MYSLIHWVAERPSVLANRMDRENQERELVAGFLAGEARAYEAICSWIDAVLGLRSWHSSIRAARDDLRQEILMILTDNLKKDKYRWKGLKTYVTSVTKFTCLKSYDRRQQTLGSNCEQEEESTSSGALDAVSYTHLRAHET